MTTSHEGGRRQARRPRYQLLADELMSRFGASGSGAFAEVPSTAEIAREYRVPLPTAQFVHRAVYTRLRAQGSPHALPMAPETLSVAERVADLLRSRILHGTLTGRLPVRSALAAEYRVSVDTVSKAVRVLAEEGLVFGAARHGTYVLGRPAPAPPPSAPAGQACPVGQDRGLRAVVDLEHGHQP
ncbi:winged helix-turn-helix domain-containing protein [Streptomyces sp. NPDC059355]|uniref:winged helix-turn-helix domain-containing protein n=1 Tax=Streptomyces sp. NPDC059355 TaxID=3346811 RepID=UPI0036BC05BB